MEKSKCVVGHVAKTLRSIKPSGLWYVTPSSAVGAGHLPTPTFNSGHHFAVIKLVEIIYK